eukprot:Nk52_evm12s163 gene=Nk52_evmTU12s163
MGSSDSENSSKASSSGSGIGPPPPLPADLLSGDKQDFSDEELKMIFRRPEKWSDKMKRKFLENPFVPVGCFVTAGFLLGGVRAMKGGQKESSQFFMRGRVLAQGLTVVAILGGAVYAGMGSKPSSKG